MADEETFAGADDPASFPVPRSDSELAEELEALDADFPPELLLGKISLDTAPELKYERKKILLLVTLLCAAIAVCPIAIHLLHTYLPKLWGDIHFINFVVAWIPACLSILVAFIPDKELEKSVRVWWRIVVLVCGLLYSIFLWHQQTLTDEQNSKQIQDAVNQAVGKANIHSDQQFDKVQTNVGTLSKEVQGVGQQLGDRTEELGKALGKATSDINSSIGKVGKPDPPERPRFSFSLWRDNFSGQEWPLESEELAPDSEGRYRVEFAVKNDSSVPAEGIELWVTICDQCVFPSEPRGFDKPKGSDDRTRHRIIQGMNSGVTVIDGNEVDVKPERGLGRFAIQFTATCKTCGPPARSGLYWIVTSPSSLPH